MRSMSSLTASPCFLRNCGNAPRRMFSLTVMGAKSWRPSGTSEQPRKTIFSGGSFPISRISNRISPERARSSPETVRRSVVFPAPLAPMIVTISPVPTCIVTFLSTFSLPYPDSTFLILSLRFSLDFPQVHPDHLPVPLDGKGTVLGDFLPVAEHHDLIRDVHDERHVVLHEQDGDPPVADLGDPLAHVDRFPHVQSGHGLIEQEELRLAGERPAQLDDALLPVGQARRFRLRAVGDAEKFQDLEAPVPDSPLLAPREGEVQHAGEEPRPAVDMPADHDVLQDRHLGEEPDMLERARHPESSDLEGLQALDRRPVEQDPAAVGRQDPGDQVEERRLARAVRPDQRLDRPARDVEGTPSHGLEAAEALADIQDRKEGHGASSSELPEKIRFRSPKRCRRSSPSGAKSMIRMRIAPKTASSKVPKYPRSER